MTQVRVLVYIVIITLTLSKCNVQTKNLRPFFDNSDPAVTAIRRDFLHRIRRMWLRLAFYHLTVISAFVTKIMQLILVRFRGPKSHRNSFTVEKALVQVESYDILTQQYLKDQPAWLIQSSLTHDRLLRRVIQ